MSGETTQTFIGNLVEDPELRFTGSGAAVSNFRIACTPRIYDRTKNEWVDGTTLFLAARAWRRLAELTGETFHKGDKVIVVGRLTQHNYQTQAGENRHQIVLEVEDIGPSITVADVTITRRARAAKTDNPAPEASPANEPTPQWGADPAASGLPY